MSPFHFFGVLLLSSFTFFIFLEIWPGFLHVIFIPKRFLRGGFPPGLPVYNYRCPVSSPSTVIVGDDDLRIYGLSNIFYVSHIPQIEKFTNVIIKAMSFYSRTASHGDHRRHSYIRSR